MKCAGKARNNGLYRHIRTSKEIIRNLLNDSFKNKDRPDYVSSYGDTYTDRQLAILNNEIPLYEIRPNELSILYKKAKQKNNVDSYEIAIQMYAEKTKPQEYIPQYTIEEAKAILQELTPWIINWEK